MVIIRRREATTEEGRFVMYIHTLTTVQYSTVCMYMYMYMYYCMYTSNNRNLQHHPAVRFFFSFFWTVIFNPSACEL